VEEMTGDMDPKTNFALIVIQTELERWKYLVRGYLRARIAKVRSALLYGLGVPLTLLSKIDRHALHYLTTPELRSRLSASEIAYVTRHQALLQNHYLASFLSSFPPALRNLDDTAGGISMIDGPDLETAVFVRALKDVMLEGKGRDADDQMDAKAGEVVVARWSDVKPLVERGDVELV
jgi:GINS complex subunit 4